MTRKRKVKTPSKSPLKIDSSPEVGDHPGRNSLNRAINELYLKKQASETPVKKSRLLEVEKTVETEANQEIDKVHKKQIKLKEQYLFSPSTSFAELASLDHIVNDLKKFFDLKLNSRIRKRILITGVPGVGKSMLAEAIVNHLGLPSLLCGPKNFIGSAPAEVQSSCKNLFNFARSMQPCVVIMDKLHLIVGKSADLRNENDKMKTYEMTAFFSELNREKSEIIIIGITNSAYDLDTDFMRAAKFIKKIDIDVPDANNRSAILKVLCKNLKIDENVKFDGLGAKTPGYVGSDLDDLVDKASLKACERTPIISTELTNDDFCNALKEIKPSLKSDGFAAIPKVTWEDIGACNNIREFLVSTILFGIKYPHLAQQLNDKPSGILLHGPPGCGKTSIAKALANECDIAFISVKGPEVLNMYVGESERKIRDIFDKAAKAKPCVIFFDEIDALCTERASSQSRSNVSENVLRQILTEMDGFDERSCFVLAATNRLDVLDTAALRPGRFGKHIYVGIPDEAGRYDILKAITRNLPLSPEICLQSIAKDSRLKNFTGADLAELIEEAKFFVKNEILAGGKTDQDEFSIKLQHIEAALNVRKPSISDEMHEFYLKSAKKAKFNDKKV